MDRRIPSDKNQIGIQDIVRILTKLLVFQIKTIADGNQR